MASQSLQNNKSTNTWGVGLHPFYTSDKFQIESQHPCTITSNDIWGGGMPQVEIPYVLIIYITAPVAKKSTLRFNAPAFVPNQHTISELL